MSLPKKRGGQFARRIMADARYYHALSLAGSGKRRHALWRTLLSSRGLWLLTFHRLAHHWGHRRNTRSPLWWIARVAVTLGRYFSVVCCRSEINSDCEIAADVYLSNGGYLICGARSIGARSLIHDHCTFGQAVVARVDGRPSVGSEVWIGPHCIIAGPIVIGNGATILPRSFLTTSVPESAVVGGNPARIIRRNFDNSALRSSLRIVDKPGMLVHE